MKKRCFVTFGALALVFAACALSAGCKPASCESVCERLNDCEGHAQVSDCADACDAERQVASDKGCKDEYESLLSCQGTIDVCSSDTFCSGQSGAFAACLAQ
jgi:hypothetical protein